MTEPAAASSPTASRRARLALVAAVLGWLFDGFEIGLFPLAARPALLSMLGPGGEGQVGGWMGIITATFLLGAALGGVAFGWRGDRVGRVKAMSLSILCYSVSAERPISRRCRGTWQDSVLSPLSAWVGNGRWE